ncbi:MAG: DNA repair protein RecN [Alistipes sp.]|nr:DNA repair protein RecN [Alistipes sp.]
MLRRLSVENYALIEKLDLQLDKALNIITGETGAGKSILLGALGLLLGNKNESGAIHNQERSCIIEGEFDIEGYNLEPFFQNNDLDYEPVTVIRRLISPSGKSRAFVNDIPVQLSVLKQLGMSLIDIHSQHRNMVLSDEGFRLDAVDTLAQDEDILNEYRTVYSLLRNKQRELERLKTEAETLRKDEEWLRYQVAEFEAAALKEGELEAAEAELAVLENADQIGEALIMVRNILDAEQIGVLEQLAVAESVISKVSDNYPNGNEIVSRLHSVLQELKDLGITVADDSERIEADPERLQRLTDRVNTIYSMCQKHRVKTLDELIAIGEKFSSQLSVITHSDEQIVQLQEEIEFITQQAQSYAQQLHDKREQAAVQISAEVAAMLKRLGMEEARFEVRVTPTDELISSGRDRIYFMFSANAMVEPQMVEKVASGGELSRVMLALKAMIARRKNLPTIIFDEIDTGVSGRIADVMGEIISELASNMQVVAITHLPQVASKGESHYVVYKHQSRTNIAVLSAEQRVEEIAKMLSGSQISEAALNQAKLLLNAN